MSNETSTESGKSYYHDCEHWDSGWCYKKEVTEGMNIHPTSGGCAGTRNCSESYIRIINGNNNDT